MKEANLLVSYEPSHSGTAKAVIENAMGKIKEKAEFLKSDVEGLFKLRVSDGKKVVSKLRKLCKKNQGLFEKTYHYMPVDSWTKAAVKDMQNTISRLQKGIKEKEKWAMKIGKRRTKLHEKDLIMKLTAPVDKPKVDLEKPDKLIKVEIIGKKAGISLLAKDEYLDTQKI